MKNRSLSSIDWLIALLAFHLINNIIWIRFNNTPPSWDPSDHTRRAFQFSHVFTDLISGSPNLKEFIDSYSSAYGPLVKLITGFFISLFGVGVKFAQFSATPYFLGLIVAVYYLGKVLSGKSSVGIMNASAFSFYQQVYDNSRWFLLDIPMTMLTTTAIVALIKSNGFQSKRWTKTFFTITGLAVLVKIQALIYIIPAFIYTVLQVSKENRSYVLQQILKGSLWTFSIVALWALPVLPNLRSYFTVASTAEPGDLTSLVNPSTWLFYLKVFINHEITFLGFLIFIPCFIYFLRSKDRYKRFVLWNIVTLYILFTIFQNKDIRFLFPVLPFIAYIFAFGLEHILKRSFFIGYFLATAYFAVHLFFFFTLSFGGPFKKLPGSFIVLPYINDIAIFNTSEFPVRQIDSRIWPNEKIAEDLIKESDGNLMQIVFIPNYDQFNDNTMVMYTTLANGRTIEFIRAEGRTRFSSQKDADEFANRYSYFIYSPDDIGVSYQIDKKAFEQLQASVRVMLESGRAHIVRDYLLPTDQTIQLVKRTLF